MGIMPGPPMGIIPWAMNASPFTWRSIPAPGSTSPSMSALATTRYETAFGVVENTPPGSIAWNGIV